MDGLGHALARKEHLTAPEVVGGISGAAVTDRCPNGTGLPLKASA